MNTAPVQQYLNTIDDIQGLEDEVKVLKEKKNQLEEVILEQFAQDKIGSISVDGRLVFISRLLVASITGDQDKAISVFRAAGLGDLVKEKVEIHPQTLGRWVRDLEEEGKSIPPEIQPYIRQFEKFSLRVRKG